MTIENQSTDNPTPTTAPYSATTPLDTTTSNTAEAKKSRFSPTVKGALVGAVAGSVLPVFGTFSGAIIGGIAGKVYEKKCIKN